MRAIALAALLVALRAAPLHAQQAQDHAAHHPAALVEGEVRRVDKDAKKITIKHGAMPKLDMPAHTMVFQVKDPAMLEQVKAGDKVRFDAEKVGGAFMLVKIEKAN
ncbi:MAG TPA: copper-binding protein [Burkholderiales bacterium]|nr:copper-binding protein [Burkholderiales bacterium]